MMFPRSYAILDPFLGHVRLLRLLEVNHAHPLLVLQTDINTF
jgi:hypothetical protein